VKLAGFGGVVGVETDIARRRAISAGIDDDIAEDLLAHCERALIAAYNEKDATDDGGEN